MTRQLVRQVDCLMCPPLWHHYDATDLLHLRVVWWAGAIQVACNLKKTKINKNNMFVDCTEIMSDTQQRFQDMR